jgi:hypothetical protein
MSSDRCGEGIRETQTLNDARHAYGPSQKDLDFTSGKEEW